MSDEDKEHSHIFPQPGEVIVLQEALGYLCGTVVASSPFGIRFGADAVWIRNMGDMSNAMATGKVEEFHSQPREVVFLHALRYWWPWPHKVPSKTKRG